MVSPLNGVTLGGPPPPSDATEREHNIINAIKNALPWMATLLSDTGYVRQSFQLLLAELLHL